MIFHNPHKATLTFELGGKRHVVPHGHDVDLPGTLAYCVESRGLPLVEGPGGGARVHSEIVEQRPVLPALAEVLPTSAEAAEELADLTGEDPIDPSDDVSEANDAAARTLAALERQGIKVPGKVKRK